ncbi:MAG: DUF3168 domain-containing protein [Alphaproteobacteria bacterium]|nr:DUF3168 domain-containing protein [Alphaproteobacteria bacterium]
MSEFSHFAMQEALFSVLSNDVALGQAISGVFDHVPPNTAYPYVTLGDMRANNVSSIDSVMSRMDITINVYSRSRGRKQVNDIMQQIYALLHGEEPSIVGHNVINLRYMTSDIEQERDGLTYRGRIRFEAFVQHA